MKTLIMGLGNDLLGDDAVGILAAAELGKSAGGTVDVRESRAAGLALLDELTGYDRVIIIDAIHTGEHPAGTVMDMSIADLRPIPGTSPHYVGLPEVMRIGMRLGLPMPDEVSILAVEIPKCLEIGGRLSGPVASALADVIRRIRKQLFNGNSRRRY
jgi:hydrogenase maturation protease